MDVFSQSKWIWLAEGEFEDQYAEFCDELNYSGGDVFARISCDSDYTLFINGKYVSSGQYGDYEHYKIYDTIDIKPFLTEGKNKLNFIIHHCGTGTSRYCPAKAGLIYEIFSGDEIICFSNEKTLSRRNPSYVSGFKVMVSVQLGYTFSYDATADKNIPFSASASVDKSCDFYERPIKKSAILPKREMKSVKKIAENHYLIDLGGEEVGLPHLELVSDSEQMIRVAWGEHIDDGVVRSVIDYRHFYYDYKSHKGHNVFTEYMLRLGCRYIEVTSEKPIELIYAGVLPQVYEVERTECEIADPLDRRIYDICVNTLEKCMMEHYVDCPWREQALYAFDSRNQMLFGYYAFRDGNAEYARSNLKLMGMDRRDDGFLSITYPCGIDLVIPSFSLHYIIAMGEYLEHTGDGSLAAELLPKMTEILEAFFANEKNGLICAPCGDMYWNFYDWSPNADMQKNKEQIPDLLINTLFVLALKEYEKMCIATGKGSPYHGRDKAIISEIRSEFLRQDGLFNVKKNHDSATELGNALAVLSGAATDEEASYICDRLASGSLTECALSSKLFTYQALIRADSEKYRDHILNEIRSNYKIILDKGSDTVWETLKGADEPLFGRAGSLCHGWCSTPIYIYRKLGIAK